MQVISKKKPLDEEAARGKRKPKGKDKRKKDRDELTFTFDQIKIFQDIDVEIPRHTVELERTSQLIQAKIQELKEKPWP
jgi:hypothetical protein